MEKRSSVIKKTIAKVHQNNESTHPCKRFGNYLMEIRNNRVISFQPCFLKMLQCLIHNRLYRYLVNEKNIIFEAVQLQKGSFHRASHCSIG